MNITEFLKDNGVVKNKQQANLVMIIVITICFLVIMISRNDSSKYSFDEKTLTQDEREFLRIEKGL